MKNTYILLSRSLLDSEVFASQKMLKIWIWCLCKASYKTNYIPIKVGRGEKTVKVKRGQFLFGRFRAEDELFIDGSTIYKILKKLEKIGNIEIQSSNHYSVITVCNYEYYQRADTYKITANEQLKDSKGTAKGQPSNTYNTREEREERLKKENNIPFYVFWNLYDYKKGRKSKLEIKWNKFPLETQKEIIDYLPDYIKSTSDKTFRKHPATFLNNESWMDEIVKSESEKVNYGTIKGDQSKDFGNFE